MRTPARVAIGMLAVVVVGMLLYFAIQVFAPAIPSAPVVSLRYSQAQKVPNFATTSHTVTDSTRIAAFETLVKKYSINLRSFDENLNDHCTGGLDTTVTAVFASGPDAELRIYDCSTPVPKGTFVTDATALFTDWSAEDK